MPIRFRCAYCNQLLGIARRKANTVVKCPTCNGQVVVPTPDAAAEEGGGDQPLFERSDFDDLFHNVPAVQPVEPRTGGEAVAPAAAPPAGAWGTHADGGLDVERLDVPRGAGAGVEALASRPAGIVLSPGKATVLTVLAVVALAVAFGAGLLVGRLL
jgi:hypothetical protein